MLQNLEYRNGDIFFPYILHLPEGYDKSKKYPYIICLHGAGERGTDFEHYRIALPKMLKNGFTREAIIVCPQCANDLTWNIQAFHVKKFIEDTVALYNGDEKQILITGLSMGGFGTWEMICSFPEMFAAAGPICGGGLSWRAERARNIPIRAYHGTADNIVEPIYSELMVNAVNKAGGNAELIRLEGVMHNSWDYAYDKDNLVDWLLQHRKA